MIEHDDELRAEEFVTSDDRENTEAWYRELRETGPGTL